jgi:hypothetical protein
MTDPFDLLRDQLVAAAATAAAPRRHRRWRPLTVLAAALALGGTATAAAVLTLGGEPSPPLKGQVPGASERGYSVILRPDLRAGAAGWCSTVTLRGAARAIGAGTGCGPALNASYPQIAGGGMVVAPGKVLDFRIVDARVAYVRLADGRRIVPRADPALPYGWRAVVAFASAEGDAELLGADGRVLLPGASRTADAPRGVPSLPVRTVDAKSPPARPCAIEHRPTAHLAALDQSIATGALARRVDASGRPFRTCSAARFRLDGERLRAAVLVDARDPARAPAPLPRAYVPALASARRVGDAWLVADGGTEPARRRLLAALTVHPPSR